MFNDRLRSTRMSRGYTQQYMADVLEIALRHYQKFEGGHLSPSPPIIVSVADILDVPTDFLLGRDEYLKSLGVSVDVPQKCPPRRPKRHKSH